MDDGATAVEKERARREAAAKSEHDRLLHDRTLLPIYAYRDRLLDAVAQYQVVVIVGETGSGKTTQARFTAHPGPWQVDRNTEHRFESHQT